MSPFVSVSPILLLKLAKSKKKPAQLSLSAPGVVLCLGFFLLFKLGGNLLQQFADGQMLRTSIGAAAASSTGNPVHETENILYFADCLHLRVGQRLEVLHKSSDFLLIRISFPDRTVLFAQWER